MSQMHLVVGFQRAEGGETGRGQLRDEEGERFPYQCSLQQFDAGARLGQNHRRHGRLEEVIEQRARGGGWEGATTAKRRSVDRARASGEGV